MQQGSDKSGFHTNRNMVGTGVILHKVYEISCIIHKQPFRRPNMRIMPETRISSSQPVLWRVSVAGTLVAPWWHSGSVAEDRTGSGGAVPVLHYPALRRACVLCVPVCARLCFDWSFPLAASGGCNTRRVVHYNARQNVLVLES